MKTTINHLKLPVLGPTYRNNWRERTITLKAHPTDPSRLISVGIGFHDGKETVCDESREEYARQLVRGNWSDFD